MNRRVCPDWERHRKIIEQRGFHLDTVRDVKHFYEVYWGEEGAKHCAEYSRICNLPDDSALCKDPGLHDNLFRGRRVKDGTRIMVKAVHLRSRELDVTRFLSSPLLRSNTMNHCIPVLDLIEVRAHDMAFIVMEEWSSQLIPDAPCCLRLFLMAVRSCIEHIAFMHLHGIAHLDISLRNLVTDYQGHYACIDFELSRRYGPLDHPRIQGVRGTELPPELERGESSDPFKVDVWALGAVIIKACQLTGYILPELIIITNPMFHEEQGRRPAAMDVLKSFDKMITNIGDQQWHDCSKRTVHQV